jgi:uncharacterized LabA/DUF88 family protein
MNKKYAVFIDGDNISSDYFDAIMSEIVKENDDVLIKRVYGDWTTPQMNSWKDKIVNSPIRVFQQFRNGPNATDNTIIMDAIELAIQNAEIDAFCIVSTDHGYYSLALRLRENGKYVLGIGKENSKEIWQNSCNQFIKIENILKGKELLEENSNNKKENEENLPITKTIVANNESIRLETIFEYALANSRINADGWISLADFGSTIKAKYPSFDPRTYSSIKLLPLIKRFPHYIEIKSDGCFPPNYYLREIYINSKEENLGEFLFCMKKIMETKKIDVNSFGKLQSDVYIDMLKGELTIAEICEKYKLEHKEVFALANRVHNSFFSDKDDDIGRSKGIYLHDDD